MINNTALTSNSDSGEKNDSDIKLMNQPDNENLNNQGPGTGTGVPALTTGKSTASLDPIDVEDPTARVGFLGEDFLGLPVGAWKVFFFLGIPSLQVKRLYRRCRRRVGRICGKIFGGDGGNGKNKVSSIKKKSPGKKSRDDGMVKID